MAVRSLRKPDTYNISSLATNSTARFHSLVCDGFTFIFTMPLFTHILALTTVALVALSSFPARANALAPDHVQAARHIRAHDAVAKRRRDASSSGTCIPRPSTALTTPTPTPTPTPTSTPSTTPSSTAAPSQSATSSGGSSKKMGLAWGTDNIYLSNFTLPNAG